MLCHVAFDVSSLCWELGVSYVLDVSNERKTKEDTVRRDQMYRGRSFLCVQ